MTLTDLWPDFKVTTFSEVEYLKNKDKDKVTIAQEEIYLTYGMVLCLLTLTDLYMRRTGLSALAQLLVTHSEVSLMFKL